jgi:hypothetical protein
MASNEAASDIDIDGISVDNAFRMLSDQTRVEILLALWRAWAMREYDDVDETEGAIRYNELIDCVGVEDNGRFNYHLSKLQPHFVTKTEDGYRLSGAGKTVVRTVVAVSGERPSVDGNVGTNCPLCDGRIEPSYDDSWLRFTCTECAGFFGDAAPEGALLNENFPPAGLRNRDAASAFQAKLYRCVLDMVYLMQGVCRECASTVSSTVSVCENHVDSENPCPACGHHSEAWATMRCDTCRFAKRLPVEFCALGLSQTIGFLYRNGIDPLNPSLAGMADLVETRFRTDVSTDPLRITVAIDLDDDELVMTLDDNLAPVS